jgi:hypothetical protein
MDLAKRLFLCVILSFLVLGPVIRGGYFCCQVSLLIYFICAFRFGARIRVVDIFVVGVIAYLFCGAMHHNFTIISMILTNLC